MTGIQKPQTSHRVAATVIAAACLLNFYTVSAADGPEGDVSRGAVAWAQQCQRCHNMRDPMEFRDDQWRVIMAHMRVRGGLDGQQARDILAFLQASNGGYWDGAGAPSYTPAVQTQAAEQGATRTARTGKAVFERSCIACHGQDGRGTLPGVPDFTTAGGPLTKPDQALQRSILDGIRNPKSPVAMPPKGGDPTLSTADASTVLAYLRMTFGHE